MSPPDRLSELRRQRALLAEHLAWLDREISQAVPQTDHSLPPSPQLPPLPAPAVSESDPDALLAQYVEQSPGPPPTSRSGCIAVFSATLLGLVAGVVVIYLIFYH